MHALGTDGKSRGLRGLGSRKRALENPLPIVRTLGDLRENDCECAPIGLGYLEGKTAHKPGQ
jgi:hypothetical protein